MEPTAGRPLLPGAVAAVVGWPAAAAMARAGGAAGRNASGASRPRHQPAAARQGQGRRRRCAGRSTSSRPNWNYNERRRQPRDALHGHARADAVPVQLRREGRASTVEPRLPHRRPSSPPAPGRSSRYKLNPKAKWSDGTPITGRTSRPSGGAQRHEPRLPGRRTNGYEDIESVDEGRRRHEVVVTFAKPFARLAVAVLPALPGVDQQPTPPSQQRLGRTTAGDRRAVQVRGPRRDGQDAHHRARRQVVGRPGQARPDHLPVAIPATRRSTPSANGEIDFIDVGPDVNSYKRARPPGGSIRKAGGTDFRHVTMNGASPILSDPKVRQALAMVINRQAIAKAYSDRSASTAEAAAQPHLHDQPEGIPGQRRRTLGADDPRRGRAAARRSRLEARRRRSAQEGRQGADHAFRHSGRHATSQGGGRAVQNMLARSASR